MIQTHCYMEIYVQLRMSHVLIVESAAERGDHSLDARHGVAPRVVPVIVDEFEFVEVETECEGEHNTHCVRVGRL